MVGVAPHTFGKAKFKPRDLISAEGNTIKCSCQFNGALYAWGGRSSQSLGFCNAPNSAVGRYCRKDAFQPSPSLKSVLTDHVAGALHNVSLGWRRQAKVLKSRCHVTIELKNFTAGTPIATIFGASIVPEPIRTVNFSLSLSHTAVRV